jgi:DNA-binding response OmpR family regulator
MMRILLVEDDELFGDGLRTTLSQCGFAADWVRDGEQANDAADRTRYDAVLLDLNLPQRSGFAVIKVLREAGNEVPVLVISARDASGDRVHALDAGADDYLVKPVDIDELCARLRALRRRARGRSRPLLRCADLVLDPARRLVQVGAEPVELGPREFTILQLLMEHPDQVLSRERIEESLYARGERIGSNAVEVHIHHLRRKLGKTYIRTVRGAGYVIEQPA